MAEIAPGVELGFDPDQPRDERGRFGSKGGNTHEPLDQKETADLKSQLEQFASFKKQAYAGLKDFKYKGMEDLILKEGVTFDKIYPGDGRPPGVEKGKDKECFKNATELALGTKGLTYVEGYASVKGVPFPIHHGWCVDEKNRVVETTWKTPGTAYVGIPMRDGFLFRNMTETQMWGVFGDNLQNRDFYKKGLPDDARA